MLAMPTFPIGQRQDEPLTFTEKLSIAHVASDKDQKGYANGMAVDHGRVSEIFVDRDGLG